jgi:hypothetical protein
MRSLFADKPNMATYDAVLSTNVPTTNPPLEQLTGLPRAWAEACLRMDFSRPDGIDDQLLNHAIWYADHGFRTPYPGESRVLLPAEVSRFANRVGGPED